MFRPNFGRFEPIENLFHRKIPQETCG